MDLPYMRSFIQSYLDLDPEDIPDAVVDKGARDGARRIWRRDRRWPFAEHLWTVTTVAGTAKYDLSVFGSDETTSPLSEVVDMRSPQNQLKWIDPTRAEKKFVIASDTTGEPTHWARWGSGITLYPTPDAQYTVYARGYRGPTDWVASAGTPDLPDEFHELVLTFALRAAYLHEDDPEIADLLEKQFTDDLEELHRHYLTIPSASPIVLNRTPSEGSSSGPLRWPWD